MALPGTAVAAAGVWHISSRPCQWRPSLVLGVLSLLTIQEMLEVSLLIPRESMNLHPAVRSHFKAWGSTQHGSLVQTERASLGNCSL